MYMPRRFIYKGNTSTHAEETDPRGWACASERGSGGTVAPLCSTLVAAKSGSICIADVHTVLLTGIGPPVFVADVPRLLLREHKTIHNTPTQHASHPPALITQPRNSCRVYSTFTPFRSQESAYQFSSQMCRAHVKPSCHTNHPPFSYNTTTQFRYIHTVSPFHSQESAHQLSSQMCRASFYASAKQSNELLTQTFS